MTEDKELERLPMFEDLSKREIQQRLHAIEEICERTLTSGRPMLTYEYDLLRQIKSIASCEDEPFQRISDQVPQPLDHVIISCGAAITENPGGDVAAAVVIENKEMPAVEYWRRMRKSSTIEQGEYDAIYFGLTQLMNLHNNPGCDIEVRLDNKLVVEQLNKRIKCEDPTLKQKRDNILEYVDALPVPVYVVWRPRNSTPALAKANQGAREALGIKSH